MTKLNKTQQRCVDALEGNEKRIEAFIAVCEANGRSWRRALLKQFGCDSNVCNVDDRHLPFIRQIRNDAPDEFFDAMGMN